MNWVQDDHPLLEREFLFEFLAKQMETIVFHLLDEPERGATQPSIVVFEEV